MSCEVCGSCGTLTCPDCDGCGESVSRPYSTVSVVYGQCARCDGSGEVACYDCVEGDAALAAERESVLRAVQTLADVMSVERRLYRIAPTGFAVAVSALVMCSAVVASPGRILADVLIAVAVVYMLDARVIVRKVKAKVEEERPAQKPETKGC